MLPLATTTWDDREYSAMKKVIDSGMFSMGEHVKEFESAFASYVGAKYCVMVNSGSSANLIAIAALFYRKVGALKAGDEVIVPAVSWSTTYYPLYQYGLRLKFVDIDPLTLNLDVGELRTAISDDTKAIFGVNLLGNPLDYQGIKEIISGRDILFFEDNCESLGAVCSGRAAGTRGLFGTYSSFFSHHISTMEGGMVTTDDEELYHIMLSLRSHGWTRHLPKDNKVCEKSDNPFKESFRFVLPGYNLRPLEISGAIGIEQLKKLPSIVDGRRNNAKAFVEIFSSLDGIIIQKEVGQSSWFGFAITVMAGEAARDRVVNCLAGHGVDCRPVVAGNFARNPVVEYFDYCIHGDLAVSDGVDKSSFFIGNHHFDISGELKEIAALISSELGCV